MGTNISWPWFTILDLLGKQFVPAERILASGKILRRQMPPADLRSRYDGVLERLQLAEQAITQMYVASEVSKEALGQVCQQLRTFVRVRKECIEFYVELAEGSADLPLARLHLMAGRLGGFFESTRTDPLVCIGVLGQEMHRELGVLSALVRVSVCLREYVMCGVLTVDVC